MSFKAVVCECSSRPRPKQCSNSLGPNAGSSAFTLARRLPHQWAGVCVCVCVFFGGVAARCYDANDCLGRATTQLGGKYGSSVSWAQQGLKGYPTDGLMSRDCVVNPSFCGFNRVVMRYCDGFSFSGMREAPVRVAGNASLPLYLRGRRILDATLDALASHFGLGDAARVLLTGCSAGGLAVYLHADTVEQRLRALAPGLVAFKAASASGFFLEVRTAVLQ